MLLVFNVLFFFIGSCLADHHHDQVGDWFVVNDWEANQSKEDQASKSLENPARR